MGQQTPSCYFTAASSSYITYTRHGVKINYAFVKILGRGAPVLRVTLVPR